MAENIKNNTAILKQYNPQNFDFYVEHELTSAVTSFNIHIFLAEVTGYFFQLQTFAKTLFNNTFGHCDMWGTISTILLSLKTFN